MKNIKLIFTVLITLVLSTFLVISFEHEKMYAKQSPSELYQVYLDGKHIGFIKSKALLEKYIDQEQDEVKEIYGVSTVYPPKNLYIQKYIGYEKGILSEKEIYDIIKEIEPFTIKGYVITIGEEEPIKVNVIDKEIFKKAANMTIEAFVLPIDFEMYKEETQPEIRTTGRIIENLYIDPWPVYKEANIAVNEHIFIDERELARYLLFGTLDDQKKYIVQSGDTIENIAFDNKLGVEEFLIVNPQFNNPNNLLFPGEEVEVGLIEPLFDVVVEEHLVEDVVAKHGTKIEYDSTARYGTSYVKQIGVDGTNRIVQKIKSISGERTEGYIASYEVLKPAVNEVIVRGTRTTGGTVIIDSDGNWGWPTNIPYIITSHYGWRWGRLHDGVDISGTGHGSPIYAAKEGTVYQAAYNHSSLGHYVMLSHANDYYTIYAHLSRINVRVGNNVSKGQIIGGMGNTGFSTGTHLHFSVYVGIPYAPGSRSFNPLLLYR